MDLIGALTTAVESFVAAGKDRRILFLRHDGRHASYNDHFLAWVGERVPAALPYLVTRTVPGPPLMDADRFALLVPWLQDPLRERFPAIFAEARTIEAQFDALGLPVINRVAALSNARKSVAAEIIRGTGVHTPKMIPVADPRAFMASEGAGLGFPLFVRDDCHHMGWIARADGPRQLRSIPWNKFEHPIGVELIDVRHPDGHFRKWRYVVMGDRGVQRHLVIGDSWFLHAQERLRTQEALAEEIEYLEAPDPNAAALAKAARALELDFVAFDYSYDKEGRMVVWEPNPLPELWGRMNRDPYYLYQAPYIDRLYANMLAFYLERAGLVSKLEATTAPREPAEYTRIFEARGRRYNDATAFCPAARETERELLLNLLIPAKGQSIADIPAGGGYLAEGIARWIGTHRGIRCVEPSPEFASAIDTQLDTIVAPIDRVPLPSGSIDRLGSLAGLHHLEDKQTFFDEAFRLVRPGGRIAVADAAEGSAVAEFLNGPVDRWSSTGHHGRFFAPGELVSRLERAGFDRASERLHSYTWDFPDKTTLVRFVRLLFDLHSVDPVELETTLESTLGISVDESGAHLRWSLIYASAEKPASSQPGGAGTKSPSPDDL